MQFMFSFFCMFAVGNMIVTLWQIWVEVRHASPPCSHGSYPFGSHVHKDAVQSLACVWGGGGGARSLKQHPVCSLPLQKGLATQFVSAAHPQRYLKHDVTSRSRFFVRPINESWVIIILPLTAKEVWLCVRACMCMFDVCWEGLIREVKRRYWLRCLGFLFKTSWVLGAPDNLMAFD